MSDNTPNAQTIRQGDDAEYVYYTEEQLDEIVVEFVKEPADEEDRRRKMIVLKLVCDLRNYRGWAVDEIETLKGLHQRTSDQLDAEIKTSAYLRKEVERLQEFELLSAELATEQRYAKEQAIKWNDYAAKLREDRRSLQAQLDTAKEALTAVIEDDRKTIGKLESDLAAVTAEARRYRSQLDAKDTEIAALKWKIAHPVFCQGICTSQADDYCGYHMHNESCIACNAIWTAAHVENAQRTADTQIAERDATIARQAEELKEWNTAALIECGVCGGGGFSGYGSGYDAVCSCTGGYIGRLKPEDLPELMERNKQLRAEIQSLKEPNT